MLDGMIFKGGNTDNQSNIDNSNIEKHEDKSVKTLNSKTTLSFRERKSFKAGFTKPLTIKTPGLEELIKKPTPITTKDIDVKFINNLPLNQLEMHGRQQNNVFNNANMNPVQGFRKVPPRDPFTCEVKYPMVFSRGQTPEIKQ